MKHLNTKALLGYDYYLVVYIANFSGLILGGKQQVHFNDVVWC